MKIIAAILLAISFSASAESVDQGIIGRFESNDAESYYQFATRVGRFLSAWTSSSSAEGCGNITESKGRFYVIIQTQNSQLSCESSYMVSGTNLTGDTIHSHPDYGTGSIVKLTDSTRKAAKNAGVNLDSINSIKVKTKNYSNSDYEQGKGFLVTDGVLMYQNGRGTEKVISNL